MTLIGYDEHKKSKRKTARQLTDKLVLMDNRILSERDSKETNIRDRKDRYLRRTHDIVCHV